MSEITIDQYERYLDVYFDKNLSELDKRVKSLSIFYDATEEEIEELSINDFKAYMVKLSLINFWVKKPKNTITLNGITYKSKTNGKQISLNVKETYKIKEYLDSNTKLEPSLIAAIVFRELNKDNTISNDLSPEKIKERREIFKTMPLEYIIPYLIFQYETTNQLG